MKHEPHMITAFGRTFAPNARALANSLFTPGGTAAGTYRIVHSGRGILFRRANGDAWFAVAVGRGETEPLVISWREQGGKSRYFYSLSDSDSKELGCRDHEESEYMYKIHEAARIYAQANQLTTA